MFRRVHELLKPGHLKSGIFVEIPCSVFCNLCTEKLFFFFFSLMVLLSIYQPFKELRTECFIEVGVSVISVFCELRHVFVWVFNVRYNIWQLQKNKKQFWTKFWSLISLQFENFEWEIYVYENFKVKLW